MNRQVFSTMTQNEIYSCKNSLAIKCYLTSNDDHKNDDCHNDRENNNDNDS